MTSPVDGEELRKTLVCNLTTTVQGPGIREVSQFETYGELLETTARSIHGMGEEGLTAGNFKETELSLQQFYFLPTLLCVPIRGRNMLETWRVYFYV